MKSQLEPIYQELLSFLRPPPSMSVTDFANHYRIASVETSAISGKWKSAPYQIEMQDVFKSPKRIAVFMTASQVGKTEVIKNIISYAIAYETGGTAFMLPSESIARDYSKAQIGPLVRDTPILREKIPASRKDGNTHLYKEWAGGYLRLVGSQKADKLSSFPTARLFVDELDRCNRTARNSAGIVEGSPVDLFLERSKNWPNRFALFTSTPTLVGASAIADWWERSDQRVPLIPCIHCGHYQMLDFAGHFTGQNWGHFTWVGKDENKIEVDPKTIEFQCGKCKKTFDDRSRTRWLSQIKWHPLNPKSQIAGFHINAFYSPWTRWADLLKKYVEAGTNAIRLMTYWNTSLGLPFSDKAIESPEWQELYERPKHYERHTVPKLAKILLAACDVQFDRLEVSIVAFYKHQSFVITHEVIIGNTTSIDDECWSELDELLAREWTHASGSKLRIHRLAIDAHYNTNVVANYARKRKRVIPVTGVDNNWKADLLPSRPPDIKKNGKYLRTGKRRWPIGVSLVKMDLYNRLRLRIGEDGSVPSEYVHFCNGLPEEYFKQLTGEVCKLSEDMRGQTKMVWEKQHDAVEALDCIVYVLALYKICGLHLWREERWG